MVTLKQFRNICKNRIAKDYDCVVLVEGDEGVGKSTLAYQIAEACDDKFDASRDIVFYDVDKFYELYDDEAGRVILVDEAVALLFNRQAMGDDSKRLVEELMECRYKRKIIIFCIPDRMKIDDYIRDHRAKYWFYVKARGLADFHIASKRKYRKKGQDGLYWNQYEGVKFNRLPPNKLRNYKEAKRMAKEMYDKKRGLKNDPIPCKKCGVMIRFKKLRGRWIPFNEKDEREHIPLCNP